ncbi:MAG TPA: alpha/beta hydrolase-fold protein, partial [Bryobacteraceae bacterium]|nr:alpha/beta hydrolase-fold protein [Bryobacteraceae bacterium]
YVYLPPSYEKNTAQRYPVVYLLHGYGLTGERWVSFIKLPEAPDKDIAAGTAKEMILVSPDAYTKYDGSMYSNSVTTGDWEAYIAHDLVSYMDSHYRTIPNRMSRGLAGHSMGGYGTIRIGMKHPEVFSSIYIMSACCLMNNPGARRPANANAKAKRQPPPANAKSKNGRGGRGGGGFANVNFAEGAAWSPNPKNPPRFLDVPVQDGKVQPGIAAKWVANSPLAMIDQYIFNLKELHAIAGDCGLQDGLVTTNKELAQVFTDFGISHTFETYEGTHTSKVAERFQDKVLPFFSQNLSFSQTRRRAKR